MKYTRRTKRRGRRRSPRRNIAIGKLGLNPRGFGFVRPRDKRLPDIYIAEEDMDGAIHGDEVKIVISKNYQKNRLYGKVKKVLSRGITEIVGITRCRNGVPLLFPLDRRYNFILTLDDGEALKDGAVVVVAIKKYPRFPFPGEGKVLRVLGDEDDPQVRVLALMEEYKIKSNFPKDVLAEAEALKNTSPLRRFPGERKDFRNKFTLTIDPSDAKDFDDALSIEEIDEGWRLGVHIADVSEYVRPDSYIDMEAKERSFSVYLVDRVIPMLPPQLSSDLCSLIENEDRLCLTVEMVLDRRGDLLKYEILPSVIRVRKRLTYEEVQEVLDGKKTLGREADKVLSHLAILSNMLYKKRKKAGMIEFDFPETKVELDEKGTPIDIRAIERTFAHRIIEHIMILANSVIAEYIISNSALTIYRVHEKPDVEKVMQLKKTLSSIGVKTKKISPSNKAINRLLKGVEGLPCKRLVHTLVLRSLPRARYDPRCLGHFGLALKYYLHFTSPIRRYPDLVVHRIVHTLIQKNREAPGAFSVQELSNLSAYISAMEEKTEEAERTSIKIKIAEYMESKVGEIFDGVISWVTPRGMFVELDNAAEGFVAVESLEPYDQFFYDEDGLCLRGRKGKVFRLGDVVRVRLTYVDKVSNLIYFQLFLGKE